MKLFSLVICLVTFFSCSSPGSEKSVDPDLLTREIIQASKDFQTAYINNDFATASTFLSDDITSTIYNSNGSPLVVQSEEQISTSGAGWSFTRFDMSNHQVFIAPGATSIAVAFDTDGIVRFDKTGEEVPYSTRASQFWVATEEGWKIIHSHWSPKSAAKGIPDEN